MRSATVIVVQCQPTASAPDIAKKHSSGKRAALLVMVLGALLQFIKRICILMVGLLRLSYRKVREGVPGRSISRLCNAAGFGCYISRVAKGGFKLLSAFGTLCCRSDKALLCLIEVLILFKDHYIPLFLLEWLPHCYSALPGSSCATAMAQFKGSAPVKDCQFFLCKSCSLSNEDYHWPSRGIL